MDVAVLVLTADPPINASEQDLLRIVSDLSVRTFVLLNKIDRLDTEERAVAEAFTRRVLTATLGPAAAKVPLLPCSARQALHARLTGDEPAYRASGMAALTDALSQMAATSAATDLHASISRAAARICVELLDEARLTQRAAQLRRQDRGHLLDRFAERVDLLARRRQEATTILTADAAASQQQLDADAQTVWRRITEPARTAARAVEATDGGAAARENAGLTAIETTIRADLDVWRRQWQERLDTALREITRRQQDLLDAPGSTDE